MIEDDRKGGTVRRRIIAIAILAVGAVTLAACAAPSDEGDDMDKAAVAAAIEQLDGVVSADVGAYNTGTPGSFGARVEITVDQDGYAALGEVVDGAVRAVAADPGQYSTYDFEVTAPDEAEPDDLIVLTLSRYRDVIPFDQGTYVGSTLSLTAAELAEVAAG